MNKVLFMILKARGEFVCNSTRLHPPMGTGCLVTLLQRDICSAYQFQPCALEQVTAVSKSGPVAQTARFQYTPVDSENERRTLNLPYECFRHTGVDLKERYWQRGGRSKKGKRIKIRIPVFECYQTPEQALKEKESITEERYDELYEDAPPILIQANSLTSAVRQEEEKELPYKIVRQCAFGVSEAYTSTPRTMILTVCWQESYKRWVEGQGWVTHQPDAFFMQLMQVFTPDGAPIKETYSHRYGKGYTVAPYYRHSMAQREAMELHY